MCGAFSIICGVLPRQNRHSVDMFDDKLTVRDPEPHITQIAGVERGFLHRLIQ